MTYKFFSVISGNAITQEIDAAKIVHKTLPLRIMYSYLYLRNFKEFDNPEFLETYLDSGAYSQINDKGDYPFSMEEYVEYANKHHFTHVATLDYPCDERFISELSIKDRIGRTVENTVNLIDQVPNLCAVIQGFTQSEYLDCIDQYNDQGALTSNVGIGSICIRKKTSEIVPLVKTIKRNLPGETKIHCYGLEIPSIKKLYPYITSSDSHTWGQCLHIGGRVLFFDGNKLRSFPRNKLDIMAGTTTCLHNYNLYLNHITRERNGLHNYSIKETKKRTT